MSLAKTINESGQDTFYVTVKGNYAYIASQSFDIYDITDPELPTRLVDFQIIITIQLLLMVIMHIFLLEVMEWTFLIYLISQIQLELEICQCQVRQYQVTRWYL